MAKNRLKSLRAVEHYLKSKGWNATSAIYRHAKSGLIRKNSEGGYTYQAAVVYAKNHLKKISDEEKHLVEPVEIIDSVGPDKLAWAKRVAETKKAAAQARHWERRTEILEGDWLRAEVFEKALAQRAATFKSDIENFIRSHASEMCHIVEGNDIKIPDLIEFWLEKSEMWLNRYARN